ncbi:MAG TPA: tetratricopeptide repeat protein [Pyrinomonadaceae bacterium]|nr:tetratricopeptide repeat protein [Pyrinomonadaceae bacterium]
MKYCPACQRRYKDETFNFCLEDGTPLIIEEATEDEPETRLFDSAGLASEAATAIFPRSGEVKGQIATSSSLTSPLARRRTSRKAIDSLAVLPLVNASNDPEMDYFSDGLTESIINNLSQLPKLRVVPRSTVFRYKGLDADPQAIGRELNVRAIFTGRVLQHGDSLVIKVELIDVEQESQLWGEQYRRQLTDIFELEQEISREISGKLRLRLSGEEKRRLVKRYTVNTAAYHLYLKGRYYTNKRTEEWIKKGIDFFQQAIDTDPNYALAYAGLADAYAFLASSTGGLPPRDTYPKAKSAALKALEIDEALAEAHTSLGFFHLMYDWNFAEAEREFTRAVKLNPGYANAHDGYGFLLKATGRNEEAIRASQRALELEPLSLFANVSLAWAYYFARDYERAIEQAHKALEMSPRFDFAHWIVGVALARQGKLDESIAALNQAVILTGGALTHEAHLGYAYALAGRLEEARQVLADLAEIAEGRYVSAYYFAIIHLGLGEHEQTFKWLERAVDERAGFLAFIAVEPMFDPLRSDARLASLLKRMGLS